MTIFLGAVQFVIILLSVCFLKCNCCSKLFFLLFWNILILLTLLNFIISGAIGILGFVGKEGVGVINIIISEENLNKTDPILLNDDVKDYINVCMYSENGDLSSKIDINSDEIQKINQLYNESKIIDRKINEINTDLESSKHNFSTRRGEEIKTVLNNTQTSLINLLVVSKNVIYEIKDLYDDLVGGNNLQNLINCSKLIYFIFFRISQKKC